MGESLNDAQVMHAMALDDMYHVQSVLARSPREITELVSIEGAGPFVRKKINTDMARRNVWSALGRCSCARLPHVEATYELPDQFVVVYDFVPGKTAESLVRENGLLPEAEAVRIACEVCEAAGALHELGIIHRDISPRNIVESADGAHLIDLGIARLRVEGAVKDTNALGTYGFAAPEQYGFEQTDARSDVYSIGCVLGYLLTGLVPNDDGYQEALADESHVSAQMRGIIQRACSFEPSSRYQSAADLSAALSGEKPTEAPVSAATAGLAGAGSGKKARGGRSSRREGRAYLVAIEVLVLITAVMALYMALGRPLLQAIREDAAASSADAAAASASSSSSASTTTTPKADSSATAPSSSSAKSPTTADSGENILQIKNLGWYRDGLGVYDVYEIANTSDSLCILGAFVTLAARSEDGSVLATANDYVSYLYPGQTQRRICPVGSAADTASVDVTVDKPTDLDLKEAKADDATVVSTSGVNVRNDRGDFSVAGEVALERAGTIGRAYGSPSIYVSVVFRDASGDIVGGGTDFVYDSAEGTSVPFEIRCSSVDYATYEIYAGEN